MQINPISNGEDLDLPSFIDFDEAVRKFTIRLQSELSVEIRVIGHLSFYGWPLDVQDMIFKVNILIFKVNILTRDSSSSAGLAKN